MKFIVRTPPSGLICDFCSGPQIYAVYGANDFVFSRYQDDQGRNWVTKSQGSWTACAECAELIETERWEQLVDRSVIAIRTKYGLRGRTPTELRSEVRRMHELFRNGMRKAA
jgi:hypothetical protein